MEGLFNLTTIGLHTLNALILLVAVYFLLYKPVRKFMQAREDKINAQLDEAQQAKDQAQTDLSQVEQRLAGAGREVAQKMADGQKRAQEMQNQMLADARKAGDQIIERAQQEADAILKRAHETMQQQATELAIEIASKVLEREVKMSDHQQLVSDFLKKVG